MIHGGREGAKAEARWLWPQVGAVQWIRSFSDWAGGGLGPWAPAMAKVLNTAAGWAESRTGGDAE